MLFVRQNEPQKKIYVIHTHFIFISRSNIMDYFKTGSEPMEVEGKAGCAIYIQPVMAEGEQGAGGKHLYKTSKTMLIN